MSCETSAKDLFLPQEAEILSARFITSTEKHFKVRIRDGPTFEYMPGQLVHAGVYGYGEVPLGISSSPTQNGGFELVVRKVGKVTSALCALEAGDLMTIRGPLGRGFPVDELKGHDVLIVAGGIGLCPTRSLVRYILDNRADFGRFTLFFGARSPSELLFEEDLENWRCSTDLDYLETVDRADDRWKGHVGVITTLFRKTDRITPETRVIVCGPPVMYKFVLVELGIIGVPRRNVFVDLERRMKCGVGKCGHCQINDKYVCLDGPVFRFSDIETLEEAL